MQYQAKDPRGWQEFSDQLTGGSGKGHALTMRGVQMKRPSLWELREDMKRIDIPTLIITGDEDDPCLEPALLMKRSIATAALAVMPGAGHTINLEDPEEFNRLVFNFLAAVDMGSWRKRDPRSTSGGILGMSRK